MREDAWIVAYHLMKQQWTSGRAREIFSQEHYDVFEVAAIQREEAEKKGRALRRRCLQISGATKLLLDGMLDECQHNNTGEVLDLQPDEMRAARRLEKVGLVEFVGDGPQSRCVRLTHMAFNPSMAPDEVRQARAGQHKLERRTVQAPAAPAARPRI